ncbi:MAG TPA: hypothetical protein VN517_06855 [Terriglobales bacterium]|nr:hypothetical protein [Terriglobales bacterium]
MSYALLFAEGGWKRMVAFVGVFVALFVGAIVWIADKVSRE